MIMSHFLHKLVPLLIKQNRMELLPHGRLGWAKPTDNVLYHIYGVKSKETMEFRHDLRLSRSLDWAPEGLFTSGHLKCPEHSFFCIHCSVARKRALMLHFWACTNLLDCLLVTRFARYLKLKLFLRGTSTSRAGGFRNQQSTTANR